MEELLSRQDWLGAYLALLFGGLIIFSFGKALYSRATPGKKLVPMLIQIAGALSVTIGVVAIALTVLAHR